MEPAEIVQKAREALNWSQGDLARRVGVSQATIAKIELGQTTRSKFFPKIAQLLNVDLALLVPDLNEAIGHAPTEPAVIPQDHLIYGEKDLPIHASAEGGDGEIIVSTEPIDFMPRPSNLEKVKGAYGLLITGTSMFPEYKNGETALVNPHLPVVIEESYIFYGESDGTARATIKHLRRIASSMWQVEQWNPPEGASSTFGLDRAYWRVAHRVVGKYNRK